MMGSRDPAAFLCAATEILPAEWRDLSDVLSNWAALSQGEAPDRSSRGAGLYEYLMSAVTDDRIAFWAERIEKARRQFPDLDFVSLLDSAYPDRIRDAYDRPPFLFFRGKLPQRPTTSIVGSRDSTTAVLLAAEEIGRRIAERGVCIVSGLAIGVDSAAHRGALLAGGETLAVLPHGIDAATYPKANAQLLEQIVASGAAVSQFRPGSPATSSSFVVRNSVISAFSSLSIIVKLSDRSGTRSEAESALRQGRTVGFYAPYCAESNWVRRTVLSSDYAVMVESIDELVELAVSLS